MADQFTQGFIKRANQLGFDSEQILSLLKGVPGFESTKDSLFSAADAGRDSTKNEFLEIGKHIGSHGIGPGVAGAGLGAGIGALTTKDKSKRWRNAGLGALTGGGLGFLAGAGNDAYHLGNNSRQELMSPITRDLSSIDRMRETVPHAEEQLQKLEAPLKHNQSVLNNSSWYDFYYPPNVISKMK